jgi:hypothetical protein
VGREITNPQSLNRYTYVLNQPTTLIDPTGTRPCPMVDTIDRCGGGLGGGNDFGGYTVDGMLVSNSLGQAVLAGGFGCLGSCSTRVTGNNGLSYQIVQTAGSTVYIGPNGEELSEASIAELGLPTIGDGEGIDTGGPFSSRSGGGDGMARCAVRVLSGVNQVFSARFTFANVKGQLPSPGGGANFLIGATGLPATQFNAIVPGRYPLSPVTWLFGYGPTLHVVGGPGFLDPFATSFSKGNVAGVTSVLFTAHVDSAFAYNPVGALLHLAIDVVGYKTRNPCP